MFPLFLSLDVLGPVEMTLDSGILCHGVMRIPSKGFLPKALLGLGDLKRIDPIFSKLQLQDRHMI